MNDTTTITIGKIADILDKNHEIITTLNNRVKTLEKLLYTLIMTDEVGYQAKDLVPEGYSQNTFSYDNLAELISNYLNEKQNEEFEVSMANLESQLNLPKDEQAFS